MPFEYRPFVNPYISSMSDLMGRGVEARSRAELSAAEAQAGAAGRLGDITGAQWSGLGTTLGQGIDAYVTEQREAPIREEEARLRALNIDRTEQLLAAGEVEAAQGVQERQRDTTRDRILANAQTRFTGPNGEVDAEGATAWVEEKFAQQLPPSYLEAYRVRERATEEHNALMISRAARAEEADLGSETHRLEIKRREEADRLFKEMTRIDDTHGLDTPESDAAHRAYYGYTRTEDPRIAISEGQLDRAARLKAAFAPSATENRYQRDFLRDQYKGALLGGDPAVIHAIEQKLYDAQIDPATLRPVMTKEIYNEELATHEGTYGKDTMQNPRYPGPFTREMSVVANVPGVSTMGSVYAPPPPLEPRSVEGAITERELAAEVERYGLDSLEEAAASYRARGVDVVKNDGSPSWLGLNQPPPRTTDIPLSAPENRAQRRRDPDIQAIIPAAETAAQRAQRMQSNVPFGEELRGAVGSVTSAVGSLLRGTPGRGETSFAISRIPYTAKDHGGLKGLVDYVVNNRAEFEDDNPAVDVEDYLEAIQRKIIVAEMPRQSPGKRPR